MTDTASKAARRARATSSWPAFLQSGFRPFFLFCGLQASIFIPLWLAVWVLGWDLPASSNPVLWHGHTMIFGFASAALTGFLLTAVPNWTEAGPVRGLRLLLLACFWLAARALSVFPSSAVPFMAADIGFWMLLIVFIAPGILKRNARRNGVFVVILTALTALSLLWHLSLRFGWQASGLLSLHAGLGLYLLAISVIGGRIIPAFTLGGLRQAGYNVSFPPMVRLAWAANIAFLVALASKLAGLPVTIQVMVFLLAAILHGIRLAGWWRPQILRIPLIWSLHLGYLFLPLGFALEAAGAAGLIPSTAAIHALGSGAVGLMILAVMTRASLGHTGRKLAAPPTAALAYYLVAVGALLRVVAAAFPDMELYRELLGMGGLLWSGGFIAFVLGYAGILIRPRIDGRPG